MCFGLVPSDLRFGGGGGGGGGGTRRFCIRGSGTALIHRNVLRPDENNSANNVDAPRIRQHLSQAPRPLLRNDESEIRARIRLSSVAPSERPKPRPRAPQSLIPPPTST